jgi:hypothetical protein
LVLYALILHYTYNMLVYIRNMNSKNNYNGDETTFYVTNREGWYIPGYWSSAVKN